MERRFRDARVIDVAPEVVWETLTKPVLMKEWMGAPEMAVVVETDWRLGGPITVRGVHHAPFVNRGTVLRFEPPRVLAYSHLSSLSRLPDEPASYSIIEFNLTTLGPKTELTVSITGSPNEVIFKHLAFYWRGTLGLIQRFVESRSVN